MSVEPAADPSVAAPAELPSSHLTEMHFDFAARSDGKPWPDEAARGMGVSDGQDGGGDGH